ncbi:MAG TPA: isocitrate lyase/phosphoenolpyruvate mutase family protein [Bauldia sp.]|nr:isocitrate lyase/phosphoenolpyruvate mutase family protein [Bauldia sp.]
MLTGGTTVNAALVFDPISARIAEMRKQDIAYMGGSAMKSAALMMPDDINVVNLTDIVDACRRILYAADISLTVDVDDAGGSAVNVYRTVRDLEQIGVAGLEIEDNHVPSYYGQATSRHALLVPLAAQVDHFKAALDARRDSSTMILARTGAHTLAAEPTQDFLDRVAAYTEVGVDAIVLPSLDHHGADGRTDIEAARRVTHLPFITVGLAWQVQQDGEWLAANNIRMTVIKDNWAYRMAVKSIIDCFEFLDGGGNPADLVDRCVPLEMVRKIMTRRPDYESWSKRYDHPANS